MVVQEEMFPSTTIRVMNQNLVDQNQEIMATSHMSFDLQPTHLPSLSFSPYGLIQNSLNKTCTAVGRGGGDHAVSCLRGTLPSWPPKHGVDHDGSGHLGESSAQRSSSDLRPCARDGTSNDKGSSLMVGVGNHSNNKNNPASNINSTTMISGSLSVGSVRMKKVKARRKVREPRFCFKTMSEVDVLDDGYKWRKYGQKVVKNTQHPRSYYRCTQENCRVKKRIERMAEDPRMVITTYEGRHVHSPSRDEDESQPSSSSVSLFW